MSTNPITGDALRSKPLSPEGQENWDLIFGKKEPESKVTMDSLYGDGSAHEACAGCGCCLVCDGCECGGEEKSKS